MGHSAGALVALLAATQAPQYFSKVVLLAASPHHLNEPGYYGGFEREDMLALLAEMHANYRAWANTFATMIIGQHYAPALSSELVESSAG